MLVPPVTVQILIDLIVFVGRRDCLCHWINKPYVSGNACYVNA